MTKANFTLCFIAIILFYSINCQTPQYNWTVWEGQYNMDQSQFCVTKSPNGLQCQQCMPNMTSIYSGFCQLEMPVDNCYAFDYCWNCMLCHDGYYVNYSKTYVNTCVSKKVGCDVYDETKKVCMQCLPGYLMNTTKNIYAKLDSQSYCYFVPDKNCVQYDIAGTICLNCITGYKAINGVCIFYLPNCDIMNGNICQKCSSNYQLDSKGNCVQIPKILNCLNQVDFTCQTCVNGYKLSNNQCVFIIDNCLTVNGQACTKCYTGYVVDTNGKCSPIPKILNCQTQVELFCQKCITGYTLSNNLCIYSIPNCLESNGQICTKCMVDYALTTTGQCTLIPRVPNCSLQNGLICSKCLDGYDLINNLCIYHIQNCLKVSGKACTQCIDHYYITGDGLCKAQQIFYDPNCKAFDQVTFSKCIQCSKGFFMNSKQLCQQVDSLCKTYNLNNGFCLSCYVGFILDSSNGKCLKTSSNNSFLDYCHEYDYTKNICLKCAEGCYFDETGKCQKYSDVNCKTPSSDLKSCSQCYKGYYYDVTQKKCLMGNFNCASWKNGKCQTCPVGYYLDGNFNCTQIDSLCKLFNPIIKQCLLCYPGYAIDNDLKCKQINSLSAQLKKYNINCAKFNEKNQCIQCYTGYFVTQDTTSTFCSKVNDLCKTYSMNTGQCTSCYLGYYRTNQGQCLRFY